MGSIADEHPEGICPGLKSVPLGWARQLRCHWIAILILVAHLGLGSIYSVGVPVWEAYDEDGHYQYVRYIATKRRLPQPGDPEAEAIWEKFQPPLYYLLAGASISWIDISDDLRPVCNPFLASGTAGVNYAIHPDAEAFPYRGTILAVHIVRLLSVVISVVGVWFTYLIALTIAPRRKEIAIGAMAVHAFWPQFLFNGSVITNGVLASAMASVITLVLIRMVQRKSSAPHLLMLGFLLGLGLASKVNMIALLPIALFVVIKEGIARLRVSSLRHKCSWCSWAIAGCLPVLLAWRILKRMAYVAIPVVGVRERSPFSKGVLLGLVELVDTLDFGTLRRALPYAFKTSFASFGWGNLEVAPFIYQVYASLVAIAGIGLLALLARRRPSISRAPLALLMAELSAVAGLALLLAAYRHTPFLAPGRYMLPGISAFCVLLSVGWDEVTASRRAFPLTGIISVAMLLLALVIPFRYIIPAYARPPLIQREDLPGTMEPVKAQFGDVAMVLGYQVLEQKLQPGGHIRVAVFWQTLKGTNENYRVRCDLVGPDGQGYGLLETYPAQGNFATSLWERGDIFEDQYHIDIAEGFPAPARALLALSFVTQDEVALPVRLGGSPLAGHDKLVLVDFGVRRQRDNAICEDGVKTSYELGGEVALIGYRVEQSAANRGFVEVTLCWKALRAIGEDYTVFVHLRNSRGGMVAQDDSQPRRGYYPTSLWRGGETVADQHLIPASKECASAPCKLYVGMYRLSTLERLEVLEPGGERVRNDEILLETKRFD